MSAASNSGRWELSLTEQAQIVGALCNSASSGGECAKSRLIETHISYVILAGGVAYKIKKAVDFGFLNFTTLQARQFYCSEEVRLNRRLAPDLYLDVVPITGSVPSPHIGGEGVVLDFAVRMGEFAQELLADNLVSREQLTIAHIDELAATLATFHLAANRANAASQFGSSQTILARALENFQELAKSTVQIDRAALGALDQWTKDEFARCRGLFEHRRQTGYVRECHGDLHLGNVVLLDGRLTPFDCIEFNDDLRWIDVMSDIAFLTMDLDFRRRADFSARLLNRYLENTGDYEGAMLLRFYQVYRAMVRAKVAALRNRARPEAWSQADGDCVSHVRLAQTYAAPRQVALVITHGYSGSGKTTLTQSLLEQAGAIRLRSDVERKRMHGLAAADRSACDLEAGLYGPDATSATYHRLRDLAAMLLTAGHPVLVDATFLKRHDREQFREMARQLAIPFAIADIHAPVDELRQRVRQRARDGRDASEATLAVLERQLVTAEPFSADERPHVVWIDSVLAAGPEARTKTWKPLLNRIGLS